MKDLIAKLMLLYLYAKPEGSRSWLHLKFGVKKILEVLEKDGKLE